MLDYIIYKIYNNIKYSKKSLKNKAIFKEYFNIILI